MIGGRVTLALAPDALTELARGRDIVLVSGTNGKSTTTHLLAVAVGPDVCWNSTGANMPGGLVAALAAHPGQVAVLEVDELHLATVVRATRPRAVIALNLSRDQLDRMHEVSRIAARWRDAFADTQPTVITNVADPQVARAAGAAHPVWVDPGTGWSHDAALCPACGRLLDWDDASWSCGCGERQPVADVVVDGRSLRLPAGRSMPLTLRLPGAVNRGNAAFAIVAATLLGVPVEVAAARVAEVESVEGRYAHFDIAGHRARLLLAKNPAGWETALSMLNPEAALAVGVNARTADGMDTSWLWDVPFERLAGRQVGVFGERASDLAVRLHHADAVPLRADSLPELVGRLPGTELDIVANYTAFREVRSRYAA